MLAKPVVPAGPTCQHLEQGELGEMTKDIGDFNEYEDTLGNTLAEDGEITTLSLLDGHGRDLRLVNSKSTNQIANLNLTWQMSGSVLFWWSGLCQSGPAAPEYDWTIMVSGETQGPGQDKTIHVAKVPLCNATTRTNHTWEWSYTEDIYAGLAALQDLDPEDPAVGTPPPSPDAVFTGINRLVVTVFYNADATRINLPDPEFPDLVAFKELTLVMVDEWQ